MAPGFRVIRLSKLRPLSGRSLTSRSPTTPDTGAVVGNGQTLTLLPGQYAGVYQGPGGDGGVPAGTRATAKLTITNPGGGGKLAVIANQQSPTSFMSYSGQ